MNEFLVYVVLKLDEVRSLAGGMAAGLGICTIATSFIVAIGGPYLANPQSADEKAWARTFDWFKSKLVGAYVAWLLLLCTSVLLPSTKQASLVYVIPKIANSQLAKEVSGLGLDATKLLREYVNDLQKKPGRNS
jgi:hypothetical protein